MTVTTSPATSSTASPLSTLQDPTLLKTQALIDGQWVEATDTSHRFDVTDPATGAHLASVPNLGAAETEAAIAAANRAWPAWAQLPAKARSAILMKWFHLLHQHAEDLARIMTAEQGKPLAEAKGEVIYEPASWSGSRRKAAASTAKPCRPRTRASATWCSSSPWVCARPSRRGTSPSP